MRTEKQREAARATLKRQWADPAFREMMRTRNRAAPHPSGPAHPRWKGRGRHSGGYVTVRLPGGPVQLEHRVVWNATYPDDPILPGEVIHHINGVKDDNRPENLEKIASRLHTARHKTGTPQSAEHRARIGASGRKAERRYEVKACGKAHSSCAVCRPDLYTPEILRARALVSNASPKRKKKGG
jgi:hypothetical protein